MRVTGIAADLRDQRLDSTFVALIHCMSCGAPVTGGCCRACGSTVTAKKNCAACGAEAEPAARFCPECGRGI
jgi:predicted amidophosphoribosyltransferase